MAKKTVIDELAAEADTMLKLCWEKLAARETTREDIERMVKGWSIKYDKFQEKEEAKD